MTKNKHYNSPLEKYLITFTKDGELHRELVCTQYSAQGYGRAFHGYSDDQLATAGGYGYDKESTLLNNAILALTGIDLKLAGVGVQSIKTQAPSHGIHVYTFTDLYQFIK